MGFMDEIKKLTHPYSDVEEGDYDDYDDEPLDNTPPAAPARDTRRSSSASSYSGSSYIKPACDRLADMKGMN